ncbi:hypothetical protein DL89DRAFT_213363, partial [Linderina pennispora]
LLVAVFLLVSGSYILGRGRPDQTRGVGAIVEAVLLVASVLFTLWVLARESRLEAHELDRRLRAIGAEIRGWSGTYAELRTPQLPTVTAYTVLRDGVWRDVPTLLVVEGDVVAIGFGEVVPCSVALRTSSTAVQEDFVLVRGQRFTPDTMRLATIGSPRPEERWRPWDPATIGFPELAGRMLFCVLETPLGNHLEQIAIHHRRTGRSVLQSQMRIVIRLCALRILPVVALVALATNLVMYGVVDISQRSFRWMGVEVVLAKTAYVLFPFACTTLWPVFWVVARIFTNATEVVLFDTLQRSKTDYEDMEHIDEFDVEALPPTKDVVVGFGPIWTRMRWLMTNCDYRNLSRSSNLSETLGSITVICSIDKEGTIAEPFCSPEQVVVPDRTDEYAILDFAEQLVGTDRIPFIIDEGWEKYLPALKTIGLNCCLNTAAHDSLKQKSDPTHRRRDCMRYHGKILPSQDTCLCKVGRAIGFAPEDVAMYRKLKEVDVFAPFHQATESTHQKDIFCEASFASMVFRNAETPDGLQLFSNGNVELIMNMCLDYYDGTEIKALDDRTISQYYSLYLNALQQDLQCLAFSYRPLSIDTKKIRWDDTRVSGPSGTAVDDDSIQHQDVPEYNPSFEEDFSEHDALSDLPEYLQLDARSFAAHPSAKASLVASAASEPDLDYPKPMLDTFNDEEGFLRDAVSEQIFLGLVTFAYDPKTDVCDFIEDLSIAGIRFVYFSRSKGRQSKSFAERLGLETDWNTCILLSSPTDETGDDGYVEDHDIKARLPRGIENIRSHLEEVDDIPLQISLFAECTPDATREMINIFQENGDVACCIGSALRDSNTLTFAVADLAVGVEPIPHFNRILFNVTQYALGAALTCIPCPLFLQHDTSLYTLMQVIREARRLVSCMQQCAVLLIMACLVLVLVNLISSLCLLPPALNGYLTMWCLWVIAPMLGASMLFVPHDENIMSTLPPKNHGHLADIRRFAVYATIRMLPAVALTVLVYVTALQKTMPGVSSLGKLSSVFGKRDWMELDPSEQWALLTAQVCAMVALVYNCVCISSTLMFRTRTSIEFLPFRNVVWSVCSAVS